MWESFQELRILAIVVIDAAPAMFESVSPPAASPTRLIQFSFTKLVLSFPRTVR